MKKKLLSLYAIAVLSLGAATANAGSVINGLIDLVSQVTGVLGIANGGTGATILGDEFDLSGSTLKIVMRDPRNVISTVDEIMPEDGGRAVVYNSASAVAVTIPAPTAAGYGKPFATLLMNKGTGTVTLSPDDGALVGGNSTLSIPKNSACAIYSDGFGYNLDNSTCVSILFFPSYFQANNGDTTSTKLGIGALASQTSTGLSNVAVGPYSGRIISSGQQNTSIGNQSSYALTTGNYNTFIGAYAGGSMQTGSSNVGVGQYVLRNATSSNNTAIGGEACKNVTSGAGNICIGKGSATTLTTGDSNIIISGDVSGSSDSHRVIIGPIKGHNYIPLISSGFGTSPSITYSGSFVLKITVGTGGTASSGVVDMRFAQTNGYSCTCTNNTTTSSSNFMCKSSITSTSAVTVTNYNNAGNAAPWAAGDVLTINCMGF